MSGHSKWATIHRQKEVKDAKRGALFSKLARAITIAVKTGGGDDPDSNFKLRIAVDKAKDVNMPKTNIERAIASGVGGEQMEEVLYEGFGPGGIAVMLEVATDNRNRTGQEIKNIFERSGGTLGGPGVAAYNFEQKAYIALKKGLSPQDQILSLIDLGVDEVEEAADSIEVYVNPSDYSAKLALLKDKGNEILSSELVQKPKNFLNITDTIVAKKVLAFLEALEDQADVQKVHANANIADSLLSQLNH